MGNSFFRYSREDSSTPFFLPSVGKTPLGMTWSALALAMTLLGIVSSVRAQSVVTSPMGGEQFVSGTSRTISWNPSLVTGMLTLSLWDGGHGKWIDVVSNVPAEQGQVKWQVPEYLEGNKFRIKLSTTGSLQGSALSRTFFSIVPPAPKVEAAVPGVTSAIDMTVHPNPTARQTRICVADLPADIPANVEVVNEDGTTVATLYNATPDAELGLCLTWDCSRVPSGIYYAHIANSIMGRAVKISVQH